MDGSCIWIHGKCVSLLPSIRASILACADALLLSLSVFFVALADWYVWGLSPSLATYIGGALILVAFGMLTYDTLGKEKEKN